MERLGRDVRSSLQLLAGIPEPLQSLDSRAESLAKALGSIQSVQHILRGGKSFIHFRGGEENQEKEDSYDIWTLHVKALNEEEEEETKVDWNKKIPCQKHPSFADI